MSIAITNNKKTMALTTGKKIVASIAALLLTVTGVVATTTLTASAATYGVVEDAALAACANNLINDATGSTRGATDSISEPDMGLITADFICHGNPVDPATQVTDLTGLEFAINADAVFVEDGDVTDLTPLAGLLQVDRVGLRGNTNLVDISPLAGLTNLMHIDVSDTSVSDLGPLAGSTSFNRLTISNTNISDLSPIANNVDLQYLTAAGTPIASLAPLSGMADLRSAYLDSPYITDVSPLAGAVNMEGLFLMQATATDYTALGNMTNLTSLTLTRSEVTDLSFVSTLTNLTWLSVGNSYPVTVTSLTPLSGLINLEGLLIGGSDDGDLTPLAGLTKLTDLSVNNTNVSDVTPLASLSLLENVTLIGTQVLDFSPIVDSATVAASVLADVPSLAVPATTDPTFNSIAPAILDQTGTPIIPTISPAEVVNAYDAGTNTVTWNREALIAEGNAFYSFNNGIGIGGWFIQSLDLPYMGIADPVLAACINSQIASDTGTTRLPDDAITQAELEAIYYLPCNGTFGNKVESVEGLQFATNLNYLYLGTNSITDISPLAELNLVELGLRANPDLTSIDALNGMSTLTRIELSDTGITSIDALQNNTGIQWLELSRTSVNDLSVVSQFTGLEFLSMVETQTPDLSFLTGLPSLNHLVTGDDSVTDYSPITSLPALRALSINGINTNDLSFLTPVTTLEDLTLNQSTLVDLTPLSSLTNLTSLSLMQNEIVDLTPLSSLGNLTSLNINQNNVSDLAPLSTSISLGVIYASYNAISDISMIPSTTTVFAVDQIVYEGIITTPETGSTFTTSGTPVKDKEGNNITPTGAHVVSYDATANEILWDADALRDETETTYTFASDDSNFTGTVYLTVEHDAFVAVNIPDTVLREALNARLATQTGTTRLPDAAISETEMKTITTFIYSGQGIPAQQVTDLTGMETAVNLTHLSLLGNNVTDVSPLAGLTLLEIVNLADNRNLADVDVFVDDTNLKELYVGYTAVSDLNAFSATTSLEILDISGTTISDIGFVSTLTNLDFLSMQGTEVSSLAVLEDNLSLTRLSFGADNVTDFSPVSTMLNLTNLAIVDSTVEDLTFLEPLTNLANLWLMNNNISNISPLAELTNLTTVMVSVNQIGDLSPIAGVSNIMASNQTVTGGTLTVPHTVTTFTTTGTLVDELGENVTPSGDDIVSYDSTTNTITWDAVALRSQTVATYNFVSSGTFSGTMTQALNIIVAPVNEITDVNLAACINTALGERGAADVITQADLATLTSLNCVGDASVPTEQITDLTGMEYATNLTSLNLTNNNITNLTPITGLSNLTTISFSGNNGLTDLTPLTGTTAFTSINLIGTSVSDLTPLASNTGITLLAVGNTNVSDLTTVSAFTSLNTLDIRNTPVTDLTPIETLVSISSLDISDTAIADLAPVSNLVNLEVFNASNSGLTSVDFMETLTALQDLDVSNNNIQDVTPLAALPVSFLNLDNNEIVDLSPVGAVANVTASGQVFNAGTLTVPHTVATFTTTGIVTDAAGDPVAPVGDEIASYDSTTNTITWDAVALRGETSISYSFDDGAEFSGTVTHAVSVVTVPLVTVTDSELADCINVALGNPAGTPITTVGMASLTSLVCADSGVTDLTGLETAVNLETVDLSGNTDLDDITPLAGLPLTDVNLDGTDVTYLTPIADIATLTDLDVSNTGISSTVEIEAITSLVNLTANNNLLVDVSGLASMPVLDSVTVNGNQISDLSSFDGTSINVTASGQTLVGTQVVSGVGSEFTYETAITVLNTDGVTPAYSGTIPVVYDSTTNVLSWVSADLSGLSEIVYVFNDGNGFSGTVTSPIAFAGVVDTTITLPVNTPVNVPIETDPEFIPVDYTVDGDLPDGITVNTDGEIVGTATENTETTVTVIITDADGNIIEQEIVIVTGTGIVDTLTAPDAPTVVLNTDGDVDVSWDAVTPDTADGTVVSYNVSYTNAAGTTATITGIVGTSYTLTSALPAGTYDFTISYVTTTGSSSVESASTELVVTAAVVDEEEEATPVGLDKLPWTGAQISIALIALAFLLVIGGILMMVRTRSVKLKNS